MTEKNLELERLVFFSDAVVAIAITLLALDLKIEKTGTGHLYFSDLGGSMHKFAAFFLSFFIIAAFWKVHHEFFHYIKKNRQPATLVEHGVVIISRYTSFQFFIGKRLF